MKILQRVEALLHRAEQERTCVVMPSHKDRCVLLRLVKKGVVTKPIRGLYLRTEYWKSLSFEERDRHITKALAKKHPNWIFGGLQAVCIHKLDHDFELHKPTVCVVSTTCGAIKSKSPRVRYIHRNSREEQYVKIDGVKVTPVAQTVADCITMYDFVNGMQFASSALRRGISKQCIAQCLQKNPYIPMESWRVLEYATPLCENGGEVRALAVMIKNNIVMPILQQDCIEPSTGKRARIDFSWRNKRGELIAGELDGRAKYADPSMTDGRSIEEIVDAERERERMLYNCGVKKIVRFRLRDTYNEKAFVRKLRNAGVPCSTGGFASQ